MRPQFSERAALTEAWHEMNDREPIHHAIDPITDGCWCSAWFKWRSIDEEHPWHSIKQCKERALEEAYYDNDDYDGVYWYGDENDGDDEPVAIHHVEHVVGAVKSAWLAGALPSMRWFDEHGLDACVHRALATGDYLFLKPQRP